MKRIRVLPLSHYLPTIKGISNNIFNSSVVYPFYASLKITARCGYNCPFCNMKKHHTPDLSTEDIKKILDNLSRSSILMTSFEGGEPFLRQDIKELLHYARKCKFYLLFTTCAKNLMDLPLHEYAPYIDFFHISIDEGHQNLEMFDLLPKLTKLPTKVSVQTVVTHDSIDALESKIIQCYRAGATMVIIPAAPMDGAKDCFPDITILEKKVMYLYKKYPNTIHTPSGYFDAYKAKKCSAASIIIAPDGHLYYPCHILEQKGPDLRNTDLTTWLQSPQASSLRQTMKTCKRNCGWYQYYSIDSYISAKTVWKSLKPLFLNHKP